MPVIKSAEKKLRQTKKKTFANRKKKDTLYGLMASFRKSPSADLLTKLFSALDKAAKKNIVHKNKASRLKSRFSALLEKKAPAKKKEAVSAKSKKTPKK